MLSSRRLILLALSHIFVGLVAMVFGIALAYPFGFGAIFAGLAWCVKWEPKPEQTVNIKLHGIPWSQAITDKLDETKRTREAGHGEHDSD